MRKIALEEHFMVPSMIPYWEATVEDLPEQLYRTVLERLSDFGERRLGAMDAAGIAISVLSLAGPGVQVEPDAAIAVRRAQEVNDALAEAIRRHPTRYAGFAHLPVQDPPAAARELERCVRELGFKGALINGQTRGLYLDDPRCFPIWECAEALRVPIYLHPADPEAPYAGWAGHKILSRAIWGWTVETATHALRIVFAGIFDRFPAARLILGHMGETLPYLLWRLDSRAQLYKAERPLALPPSAYIRRNILVTTSGQCAAEPLLCALSALGAERVMFSVDYPFESADVAARFIDTAPVGEEVRARICHGNAAELLGLERVEA
ncbi:MAG: amidohydrolase family protein [Rhodovarius sp.]|nr:amidohydrolase family protein [Rhodovarius sp.]MCX7931693.1 amidohydrolase family protein [Rhodovarius sp.]MDW8313918.1 amidohydrolase family protein [Rhodovarius sp.]